MADAGIANAMRVAAARRKRFMRHTSSEDRGRLIAFAKSAIGAADPSCMLSTAVDRLRDTFSRRARLLRLLRYGMAESR